MSETRQRTVWDGRVKGTHGIARFASEVYRRLEQPPPSWEGRRPPYSALAPVEAARELRARGVDLLLSPTYAVAIPGPYRQVITIHDLILLADPDETSSLKRAYFELLVKPVVRRSGLVMTVSEYSQKQICTWAGLTPDQVVVVGNGCSMPTLDDPATARTARAADPYVLFVGNDRPHKNFATLARAMARLQPEVRLVTVGLSRDAISRVAQGSGLDLSRVEVRTGVDDATLEHLYTNASVLSAPSTLEGFGLIGLEAAARGVPTVFACDALEEVLGTTGIRSGEPHDDVALTTALDRALSGPADHAALVDRARLFRWDAVARRVDEVHAQALAR